MNQPRTSVKFDKKSFDRIKKALGNLSYTRKRTCGVATLKLPAEIGLQLTNRCNLRCAHCFQWNKDGHHQQMPKEWQDRELPFNLVEKVFAETTSAQSGLFLWGGEPMFYSHWDELTKLLELDPRWTVNCTNGILIEKKLDSLLRCSKTMVMLISVEGLGPVNDALRGKKSFEEIMKGINTLLNLKRKGVFKGEVSINCTIHEGNIDSLYEIVSYFEELKVNTIYLNFPWYLSSAVADSMDEHFAEHYKYLHHNKTASYASWHGYCFHLPPQRVDQLEEELHRIRTRKWDIRVRLQPALESNEVRDFVIGERTTMDQRSYCAGMHTRMDVMSSGRVSTCKLFPEFEIGSLKDKNVSDLWLGGDFSRFRETHEKTGLMPICSKCIVLHLQGL